MRELNRLCTGWFCGPAIVQPAIFAQPVSHSFFCIREQHASIERMHLFAQREKTSLRIGFPARKRFNKRGKGLPGVRVAGGRRIGWR